MKIQQFEDKYLSHYSYAILSECERKIILIDPSRNPEPYYEYARQEGAAITGVIETHSHADFVSCHLEIHRTTGAAIYVSRLMNAKFEHKTFDDGDLIELGKIKLHALNTPGHSNDSISILLEHDGKQKALFTGDTLFIGDVGRPDLRESQKNAAVLREELAKKMFRSLREKVMILNDNVVVYPAHGAGSLCGKSLSKANSSTIGREKVGNWALRDMTEDEFVKELISNQPFIPAYFPYDVELNMKGADNFGDSVPAVKLSQTQGEGCDRTAWVVDVRAEEIFKEGHLPYSVNIMEGEKFETWLGTIIRPDESFCLAGETAEQLNRMIRRTASIGYEKLIKKAFVITEGPLKNQKLPAIELKDDQEKYTIVDVRNASEVNEKKIFTNSISIPLPELRKRFTEIPVDKPIVVHCAAGYRSAAGSSILAAELQGKAEVYDLGEAISDFK
ncbi:MBL fold metallo-hydrolase [Pararcticibacter amylolyticus]|uniref:MBL fold metallo-hydrolase n=1 Tax=Pararcticibacter amylolyticus TaxID=2173175 RepID=A0A2U2PB40_9SPHI|nr:MBL fold metallo-hydrolase [Pararcticibacter amylolyticus]PWG78616.1 MBL fold metallo-hydrolase [Pararcticibacter amylolyticus]